MRRATVACVLTVGWLTSLALAQSSPVGRPIQCSRQGLDSTATPPKVFNATRCRMVFKVAEEVGQSIIARRKDTGAEMFRKDGLKPGETVEVVVAIPQGLPGATETVMGQVVVSRASANPDVVLPINVSPTQETIAADFVIPSITLAEFLRALIELGGS